MRPAGRRQTRRARRRASTSTRAEATSGCSRRFPHTGADDRLDDPALPALACAALLDDPAARHHDHAITQPGELEPVARLEYHRGALRRLLAQHLVDLEVA